VKGLLQGGGLAAGIRSASARNVGLGCIAAFLILVSVATPAFAAHAATKTTTVTTTVTATVTSIKTTAITTVTTTSTKTATSFSTSTTTRPAVTVTSTKNYTTTRPPAAATVTATKTMTQLAAAATVTVSVSKSSTDPVAAQSSPQSSGGISDTLLYFLAGVGIMVTAISIGMLAFREKTIEDYGREAPGHSSST
jgi:hypothetical protein